MCRPATALTAITMKALNDDTMAVCRRCSVVDTCLAWALESGQDAGVWGGLSEDERRALKRRNARNRARLG